jgi:hypothetical protein
MAADGSHWLLLHKYSIGVGIVQLRDHATYCAAANRHKYRLTTSSLRGVAGNGNKSR